jgi:regulator of cell morphogenesis and NO signaling
MNIKFDENNKIGDIVTQFPLASDVFYNYNIDFCCGGNRPLIEAIKEQKLDKDRVIDELNNKFEIFNERNNEFVDWAKEEPGKLIDYIVSNYHASLKEELPKISDYVFKILKVHGKHHKELFKVHKLFNALRTELEEHLVKEEEFVFPLIKQYEVEKDLDVKNKVLKLIDELEQEHTGAGDIIKELREVTDHYKTPSDGCRTFEETYRKLKKVEVQLFEHIHLENNILFKKF